VPALVSRDLFDAVAERLAERRRRCRERRAGPAFLLSGLLVCDCCGSACCGYRHQRRRGSYVYYRCVGTEKRRHGGVSFCNNASIPASLEDEVWAMSAPCCKTRNACATNGNAALLPPRPTPRRKRAARASRG